MTYFLPIADQQEKECQPAEAWPSNLIETIQEVVNIPCKKPAAPEFRFGMNLADAEMNFLTLTRKYGGDLSKALHAQRNSPLGYGSEFRQVNVLQKIFGKHPIWPRMRSILSEGSNWPLDELDSEARSKDLHEAIVFGNHKGAEKNPALLRELVGKDVKYAYAMPLPLSKMHRLEDFLMAPMNIQKQNTIDEHGMIIEKDRLTHDQSYEWTSGTSVNSRVDSEQLLVTRFGPCLRRIINWAVSARIQHPGCPILASKIDFKSAYRRAHLNALIAMQTCTQIPQLDLAFVALRLTFGGSPGPSEWGAIAEPICDLTNAIIRAEDWNFDTLRDPNDVLVPPTKLLGDEVPFEEGRQLIVDIPVDPRGTSDVYIDDLINLTVLEDGSRNDIRIARAALLAIHTTARPLHPEEPIPREEMAALAKLLAEAGPEEVKIILGWLFNFRTLTVSLPDNKFIAWSNAIRQMQKDGKVAPKELESTIGRLTHLGMILPFVFHFMSRLRELHRRSLNRRTIAINETCKADLHLMQTFLQAARKGVSMNLIAYRKPTHAYRSDSCPAGLGGYSHAGWAWRFYVPMELQGRASNNLLEHIASIITVWVDILAGRLKKGDCCLSMTDSTTSEGWSRKTNFKEDCEEPIQATIRIEVARFFATLLTESGIKNYSQWFPGKENDVSDALSRDDDRDDEELTNVLRTFVPSQVPRHFEIVPLPSKISSWLTSLLQKLPVKEQLLEQHTRTKLGRFPDGSNMPIRSASSMTTSSTTSQEAKESSSWEPLPWLCGKQDFQEKLMIPWLKAQSEIPSHMWFRPSGTTTDRTLPRTRMASLADFYLVSSEDSDTKTPIQSSRKPSPSSC